MAATLSIVWWGHARAVRVSQPRLTHPGFTAADFVAYSTPAVLADGWWRYSLRLPVVAHV